MGTVAAVSFCTVLLLFQPQPSISQAPLGKPGESAPAPTVTPAEPATPPPAPAQPAGPPEAIERPAPPPAQPAAAPAAQRAVPQETGGRVAAFWVVLPE